MTARPLLTAGVDEAGRGCLAGPVAVSAVILDPAHDWEAVDDSKQLSRERREELADMVRDHCLAWRVVLIDRATIDQINILQATLLGMRRAVKGLDLAPELVLIDGNRAPELDIETRTLVDGDALEKCIGAASILAKTHRDAYMTRLDSRFPEYGFGRHKGYGTPEHLQALQRHGPTPEHRRSFAPVRDTLQDDLFGPANPTAAP